MTKKFRRILCGVLTTVMASSLVLEQSLRMDAENVTTGTTSRSVSFKEANGLYDFSQIQMENFNSTVLKNEGCVYETRTVIVSLSAPSLLESAAGEARRISSNENGQKESGNYQKTTRSVFRRSFCLRS